jgi:death-on-curing protein
MNRPNWLNREAIEAIHSISISRFGGGEGLRDASALETSLNRPLQHFSYGDPEPSIFGLAAVYCSGIVKSHPFIDGNKRTGFMAAYTFLGINGYRFEASEEEAALQILALADNRLSDEALTEWLEANCSRIG